VRFPLTVPLYPPLRSLTDRDNYSNEKRELIFKEEGQEYAQVIKMLGNGRLEAYVCVSAWC